MVVILMISAKMATLGLLKIKVFWNKDYDVILYVHDIINQILSRDSNCIVDVAMWPKFGNCSIYMREDHWPRPLFLRGGLRWISITWDWH